MAQSSFVVIHQVPATIACFGWGYDPPGFLPEVDQGPHLKQCVSFDVTNVHAKWQLNLSKG